ncbi:protocadherin Fat 1 [Caerostris extrusa]|uniref:Protocadherin Fat 1 n=1 Tax=Caerostris extrusa TaxID=172846 RepID=A0AAV4MFS8_CAEEX|nr:protocadherin Fat 1 [Caerostris extrusa]
MVCPTRGSVTMRVAEKRTTGTGSLSTPWTWGGAIPLSGRLDVYIEVLDDNDNVPLTIQPAYYPSIPENAPPGAIVLQMEAFDWDLNDDNKIRFSIASGDPQGYFSIDNGTGKDTCFLLHEWLLKFHYCCVRADSR